MQTVLLARHGESELSARGVLNGDPSVPCRLTRRGEEQARALGRSLPAVEVALTSDFERCRQTALLALAGTEAPLLELPELGDIRNGVFEGAQIAAYAEWARAAPLDEAPPNGGESRTDLARRFAAGLRLVLARPEATALVVTHQLPLGDVLAAAAGRVPTREVTPVPHGRAFPLAAAELAAAATLLEAWADATPRRPPPRIR